MISAYRREGPLRPFQLRATDREDAWSFVREQLRRFPAERRPHVLFDRMVAFHVRQGAAVPLSAGEFFSGLAERFADVARP